MNTEEFKRINFKLQGIFELRDLMMKVRSQTIDVEKNIALTQAIDLSFDMSRNYLEQLVSVTKG